MQWQFVIRHCEGRNRTGTPCEAMPSPVPLLVETTLFPSVRFQDDGATKQSSLPTPHAFIDCRALFVRCLGFPSRSALPLIWLCRYSLRASFPGLGSDFVFTRRPSGNPSVKQILNLFIDFLRIQFICHIVQIHSNLIQFCRFYFISGNRN